MSQIKQLQ